MNFIFLLMLAACLKVDGKRNKESETTATDPQNDTPGGEEEGNGRSPLDINPKGPKPGGPVPEDPKGPKEPRPEGPVPKDPEEPKGPEDPNDTNIDGTNSDDDDKADASDADGTDLDDGGKTDASDADGTDSGDDDRADASDADGTDLDDGGETDASVTDANDGRVNSGSAGGNDDIANESDLSMNLHNSSGFDTDAACDSSFDLGLGEEGSQEYERNLVSTVINKINELDSHSSKSEVRKELINLFSQIKYDYLPTLSVSLSGSAKQTLKRVLDTSGLSSKSSTGKKIKDIIKDI